MSAKGPSPTVDMTGSMPVGHYLALTAAVRHLHSQVDEWQALPPWLCVRTQADADGLKGCLTKLCESLEPTARKVAAEHGPAPTPPKLTLIKQEVGHDTEG